MTPLDTVSRWIGRPVYGILGYDVLRRYVTEIDYANERVVFHPPSYSPPGEAVRLPMRFAGHLPLVDVRLTLDDGREIAGRFLVDTGAGSPFVVTRAFAARHKIEIAHGVETTAGVGVGGASEGRIGRLPRVAAGGFVFERPVVTLSRDTRGVLSSSAFDGLIGGELLRRFTLFVDYGRRQFALIPNASLRDPFEFDMCGLQLVARDDELARVVVDGVVAGSPAEQAGIRAGDELVAIDGAGAAPEAFDQIRRGFKQPGRRFELTIVRDGVESVVAVITRRLV